MKFLRRVKKLLQQLKEKKKFIAKPIKKIVTKFMFLKGFPSVCGINCRSRQSSKHILELRTYRENKT